MRTATMGQVLLNRGLPPALRDWSRTYDKKAIGQLFDRVAREHPELYPAVAKHMIDVGREAAYRGGGLAFGLQHMRPSPTAERIKAEIVREVAAVRARPGLDRDARARAVVEVLQKHQPRLVDAVFDDTIAEGNPLGRQVQSVGRGNKSSLAGLRAGDLLYEDHRGNPIPVPVLRSYAQGLTPAQYFAASFGARKGIYDVKAGTAKSGYFGKQLTQVEHRLVVTGEPEPEDGGADDVGLPVDADDPANEGALLARAAGPYPRNTVLTPSHMSRLKAMGVSRVLVRSPAVGGPRRGGVWARDLGVREHGRLPHPGEFVGTASGQALAEKMTQMSLSSKHAGGVAGASNTSGFAYINNLTNPPKSFPGGAAHARVDGRVSAVEEAPQGGWYVDVAGERHYTHAALPPVVKPGDDVEAGDVLSEGAPIPSEIVEHKGVGEGRRYFVKAFMDAYRNSGMPVDRRNVELLARGLIDHVRLHEEVGDHVPDDVVSYAEVAGAYEPRPGAREASPRDAVGRWLERPVLHHTIGTKIRPSMLKDFEDFGVGEVLVHDEPPPFSPVFVRAVDSMAHDPDFMTRQLGSGLGKATLEAAHRGRASDAEGFSYVPALAERAHFGLRGATAGTPPPAGVASVTIRDGDGDGRIRDGRPDERPAPRSVLQRLGL